MTKRSLVVIAALGVLAAGCGGTPKATVTPVAAPTSLPSSAAPSPSKAASPSAAPAGNPLTGLAPQASPVVVIKVDNAVTARRYHRGLGQAAVVYEELVESGQTRLAAVYDNAYAGEVGPIRSVRETDIELLAQYGRVAVGFSGGNTGVKRTFSKAVAAGKLLDASYDVLPGRYRLAERRSDARNFFTTPAKLADASHAALPQDIGLRFGPLAVTAGKPVAAATMRFSDVMYMGARYNPSTGRWSISQDGRAMTGVAPTNVIVQYVTIKSSRYVDVMGAPTPYTVTTGTGNALIMRDGRAVRATWRRLSTKTGTRYVDDKGRDIPLKPGSTWIVLLPKSRTAAIS
ncbi:MAG: DUF3048 domain-containing protein [Frankiaceae bacterium]|nr:DUF3048 domain-containing protein [Frankiaceae bacterium]